MKQATSGLLLSVLLWHSTAFADGLLPPKEVKKPAETAQTVSPEPAKVAPPALVQPAPAMPNIMAGVQTTMPKIDFTETLIPLSSRLKKTYKGYNITVSNNSPDQIELLHGEITNGMNGQAAALGAQRTSAAVIGGTLGTGLVVGLFTFGIGLLAGLLATPFEYAAVHHGNKKVEREGVSYPNQVNTGIMNTGDNITISTLVPLSQKPQLKLTCRNLRTNEIFSVSH